MKKHMELDRIMVDISDRITSEKELTQEQIFYFMKKFIADSGSFFDEIKSKSYKTMRSLLNEMWQYREWKNMSSEQAFLYGQLYGCVKLCEYREQNRQETAWINSLVSKFSDSKLFHIIKKYPGIRHKELAKAINVTPGRLSQIMDDEDMNELLSSRLMGREKYYFLGAKGEELLHELEVRNQEVHSYADIPMDKIVETDNTNMFSDIGMMKVKKLLPYRRELLQSHYFEYCTELKSQIFNNDIMPVSTKGEKKCLTEENSYYDQSTNHLKNGLQMSLAK